MGKDCEAGSGIPKKEHLINSFYHVEQVGQAVFMPFRFPL